MYQTQSRDKYQKIKWLGIIMLMIGLFLGWTRLVSAQAVVSDPGNTTAEFVGQSKDAVARTTDKIEDTLEERIYKVFVKSAALSLKNLAISLTQDLSQRSIEYLETGSFGQTPVWETDTWTAYVDKVEEAVLTDVLADLSMSGPWSEYFDICEPNVELKLRIIRSIEAGEMRDPFDRRAQNQRCSWNQVKDNWEGFADELQDRYVDNPEVASFLTIDQVVKGFEPQQSQVGTYIWTYDLLETEHQEQVEAQKEQRREGEGSLKPKTDVLGNTIQNPPGTTKTVVEENVKRAEKAQSEEITQALATIESIPEAIGTTLLNSFVSQRFVEALFKRISEGYVSRSSSYNPAQGVYDYVAGAERAISKIQEVRFSVSEKEVDLLSEFTICDSSIQRQINHCVMSDDFADAVRSAGYGRSMSVREAVDEGFLKGNLPFISHIDNRNLNPDCYENAYCYSNLIKLRKARIIPIGWELAAKIVGERNPNGDDRVTLNFLMDCFNSTDPSCVSADFDYTGLVDPNWVLKYPKTRCDAIGYGPLLITSGAEDREEYCADLKSCVDENEDGSCDHYAYCAAEKNVWQFGGEQCPGYYDSCSTVTRDDGKRFNYLLNTVDYASCSADDVGCLGYSSWLVSADGADRDFSKEYPSSYYKPGSAMVYLNQNIESETCAAGDEGCTRVIHMDNSYRANLVANGGFSYYTGNPDDGTADIFAGWNNGQAVHEVAIGDGIDGPGARMSGGELALSRSIMIAPKKYVRYFTYSITTRATDNVAVVPTFKKFDFAAESVGGEVEVTKTATTSGLDMLNDSYIYYQEQNVSGTRKETLVIVRVAPGVGYLGVKIRATGQAVVDNILIAESEGPNDAPYYYDYGRVAYDYLKVAPDHYACYDAENSFDESGVSGEAIATQFTKWYTPIKTVDINTTNDNAACGKFATQCSAEEVGCQEYIPTAGGPAVTGVASYDDVCPAQCAGYEVFSQAESSLAEAEYPVYFIADSAESCSANDAGCEGFTNLDELDRGGESEEFFKSIRMCYKTADPANDSSCGSYVTWIGDDTSGYQLQVYRFQMNGGSPKVTNMAQNQTVCNAANYNPVTSPECREFISEGGSVFYEIMDNLVLCSDNCFPYRKTIKYEGATAATQCTDRGGAVVAGECVFMVEPDLSRKCSDDASGCREFRGDNANDQEVIFSDSFDGETYNWTANGAVTFSTASMINGGKSLQVNQGANNGVTLDLPNSLAADEEFIIDFWAKADQATASVELIFGQEGFTHSTSNVNINQAAAGGVEFYHYTSDLMRLENVVQSLFIRTSGATVYFDSINIKRLNDVKYLIKNSWSTPAVCDQTMAGQYLPQAQIGCREYATGTETLEYLKGFRSLCRFEAVGCEAVIDTQNSTTPFELAFNATEIDVCAEAVGAEILDPDDQCQQNLAPALCPLGVCAASSGITQTEYDSCADDLAIRFYDLSGNLTSSTNFQDFLNTFDKTNLTFLGRVRLVALANTFGIDLGTWSGLDNLDLPFHYVDDTMLKQCQYDVATKGYCQALGHVYQEGKCYKNGDQYTIPADNVMFVVFDEKKTCQENTLGCMMLGRPKLDQNYNVASVNGDPEWDTAYYVIDPNQLDKFLCRGGDSRCQSYEDEGGQTYYFKDPGDRTCEYKVVGNPDGSKIEGWYKTGTDQPCGVTIEREGMFFGGIRATKDYYNDGVKHLIHSNDPDYSIPYRDADGIIKQVTGWVGECKPKASGCTAFIDPMDVSGGSAVGEAYYYINDEKLSGCSGVSEKEGCLLFLDTSIKDESGNISVSSSAGMTYKASNDDGGKLKNPQAGLPNVQALLDLFYDDATVCHGLVNPECQAYLNQECFVSSKSFNEQFMCALAAWATEKTIANGYPLTAEHEAARANGCADEEFVACYTLKKSPLFNNTNRIIKVDRDRECAEWYDCKSGQYTFDPVQNREVFVCQDLGLCDQVGEGETAGECSNFVSGTSESLLANNNIMRSGYQSRDKGWNAFDYSGYSVADKYPIQYYDSFDVARESDDKDYRLVHKYRPEAGGVPFDCVVDTDCGDDGDLCAGGECVEPLVNNFEDDDWVSPTADCRAYPQVNSPFPSLTKTADAAKGVFENATACTSFYYDKNGVKQTLYNDDEDCACNYKKVTYGNRAVEKYFDISVSSYLDGFCQDDQSKECECSAAGPDGVNIKTATFCSSLDCVVDGSQDMGMCMRKDVDQTQYKGWQGYCMEFDNTVSINGSQSEKACLTWYPLDTMNGLQDMYNQFKDAGYELFTQGGEDVGRLYCINAAGLGNLGVAEPDANTVTYMVTSDEMTFTTGYSGYDEYMEYFREPAADIPVIHESQVAGIAIECTGGQAGDWCESVADWNGESDPGDGFENKNKFVPPALYDTISSFVPESLIIPRQLSSQWQGLATCNGTKCLASGQPLDADYGVSGWTYWQAVWEQTPSTSFNWGPGTEVEKGVSEKNYMFAGKGYFPYAGGTYNILTGTQLTTSQTTGSMSYHPTHGFYVAPANLNPGGFTEKECVTTDDGDHVCQGQGGGVCVPVGNKYYCSNRSCTEDNEQTVCNFNSGWGCQVDGEDADLNGWCVSGAGNAPVGRTLGGYCNQGTDDNYFGIRVVFDENGIYKGVWVGLCDESSNYGYQTLRVHFLLNEYCAEVVSVAENVAGNLDNKARTNRLYHYSLNPDWTGEKLNLLTAPHGAFSIVFNSVNSPMGSAFGSAEDVESHAPILVAAGESNRQGGSPFSDMGGEVNGGTIWGCPNGQCSHVQDGFYGYSTTSATSPITYSKLEDIFAAVYSGWRVDDNYIYDKESRYERDRSADLVSFPPVVAGVVLPAPEKIESDPVTGKPIYLAVPKTVSINGRASDDLVLFGGESTTLMQFFAWADDDQMPIRKVTVDWRDGEGALPAPEGHYKNHKPLCQLKESPIALGLCQTLAGEKIEGYACLSANDCYGNLTCNAIPDPNSVQLRFGDSPTACVEQEFFKYETVLTCEGPTDPNLKGGGNATANLCAGERDSDCWNAAEQACQFVPRVQVKDNWGWCNADPSSTVDGCRGFGNGFAGCYDVGERGFDACSTNSVSGIDPWTYFDGRILLKP
ncbi:TPA: hypothetical protein DF272_04780 [Candidatus Falkowbacteria bacterium]|nr:hypothetical protein [Candidatus Falkowbacteria bacterium]